MRFTRISKRPLSTRRSTGARRQAQTRRTSCSLELGEISGLVEACGRIEVHETGFRAERARPAVLIVGQSRGRTFRRRGVERVARLHRAELLEVGGAQELVDYCERRGGVLDQAALATLLEPLQTDGPDVVDLGGLDLDAALDASTRRPARRTQLGFSGSGRPPCSDSSGCSPSLWYALLGGPRGLHRGSDLLRLGRREAMEGAGPSGAGARRPLEVPGRRRGAHDAAAQ